MRKLTDKKRRKRTHKNTVRERGRQAENDHDQIGYGQVHNEIVGDVAHIIIGQYGHHDEHVAHQAR